MKCGAALVTTYNGGNLEYCRHEENALMSYRYQNRLGRYSSLDPEPSLTNPLAQAGEKEAIKWTWERSVTTFEQALQQMISK